MPLKNSKFEYIGKGEVKMDAFQSLQSLLNAPVIIDDDIWHSLVVRRNKESVMTLNHLSLLLQELYKKLLFNREEQVYFLNISKLKKLRLKVEIKFTDKNKFFIKVSQGDLW